VAAHLTALAGGGAIVGADRLLSPVRSANRSVSAASAENGEPSRDRRDVRRHQRYLHGRGEHAGVEGVADEPKSSVDDEHRGGRRLTGADAIEQINRTATLIMERDPAFRDDLVDERREFEECAHDEEQGNGDGWYQEVPGSEPAVQAGCSSGRAFGCRRSAHRCVAPSG